jgi:hypothetical protein
VNGLRNAYKVHNGKPKQLLEGFKNGVVTEPTIDSDAKKFALAIQGLPEGFNDLITVRDLLLACYEMANTASSEHSSIFRAACRLDELFYKPKVMKNV